MARCLLTASHTATLDGQLEWLFEKPVSSALEYQLKWVVKEAKKGGACGARGRSDVARDQEMVQLGAWTLGKRFPLVSAVLQMPAV